LKRDVESFVETGRRGGATAQNPVRAPSSSRTVIAPCGAEASE
jgi:hypothetical protein